MICPECMVGKHRNCDGKAWDFMNDCIGKCECNHGNGGISG